MVRIGMNHSNLIPTLTLPRQWGGNILKKQRISPSLGGRGWREGEGSRIPSLFPEEIQEQIHHPVGKTPFVVVPGNNLHHLSADHFRGRSVHDRGMWVPVEVNRDEGFVAEAQDSLQLSFRV